MRKVIIVLLLLMFLSLTFFPGCTAPGEDEQRKISEVRPTQIMGYGSGEKEYSLSRKTELALFDEYNGEKVEYNTILRIEDIDKRG